MPLAIGELILEVVGYTSAEIAASATLTAVASVIGSTVVAAATFVGSQLLQPSPKSTDGQLTLQQPVPFRRRIYGRAKVGGYFVFWTSQNGNLYEVIAIASGEITGFLEHWLGDRRVVLSDDNFSQSSGALVADVTKPGVGWVIACDYPPNCDSNQFNVGGNLPKPSSPNFDPANQDGALRVRILSRNGTDDQASYQELIDAFPGIWTSNHKGLGIADVYLEQDGVSETHFPRVYPGGPQRYRALVKGVKIHDPRYNLIFDGDGHPIMDGALNNITDGS